MTDPGPGATLGSAAPRAAEPAVPHWAERFVRALDDGIAVPGTRFRIGLDGLIGLIVPSAGDVITAASSLSLFWLALQRGVPKRVLARMALNVALDTAIGAVPVVGDLYDFVWKSNRRNLRLIERAAQAPTRRRSAADYLLFALAGLAIAAAVILPLLLTWWLLAELAG